MCKEYGYTRISRKTQSIDRQIRNIKAAYPNAVIIQEAYTGTKIAGRKEFEKLMTVMLLSDAGLFVIYLIIALAGIFWLKLLLGIADIVIAVAGLYMLYSSQELLKQRSLWLSCGFFAVLVCTLVSMILSFP